MDYDKKVGAIMLVVSIVVAIIALAISDCPYCNFSDHGFWYQIMHGFRILLFESESESETDYYKMDHLVDIQTKSVLLPCLVIFALGLLYYIGALKAPRFGSGNKR